MRQAGRVGVHERHVPRRRRTRKCSHHLEEHVRHRPRRHRRRSRVPRGVRRRARVAGELRVPRAADAAVGARRSCEEYKSGTRKARTISGATVGLTKTRIITKRLHDRPDDSWTIDGAVARRRVRRVARRAAGKDDRRHPGTGEAVGTPRPGRRRVPGRDRSGRSCRPTRSRATSSSTPTKASRRRSRTACSSSAIRTSWSRASRSRRTPMQCNLAFVYVRGEFALGYERLTQAIADAKAKGFLGTEHPRLRLRPRHRRAPRRRRVHLRRGDRAARVARGRARYAAHPAAVPRDRGSVREAHGREQRRDAVDGAAHHEDGRRGVRQARREPLDRHAHLLGVGPRQQARQLRSRARHDVPRSDLRPRGRYSRTTARSSSSSPAARRRSG